RDEWMGATYTDQLISADFDVLQFGQDAFQHGARLLGRITDGHHFIDFAINYATSTLQLWVNNNENWFMMKQVSVPAFITGQWYHARLLTVGTMSYGKVWAFGTAEPNWQISGSQGSLKSGMGGSRSTFCNIFWNNFQTQGVTTIVGKVTNSSGTAIAGATVTDGTNTATTDANGNYALIEANTSASYTVTASASGFTSQNQNVTTTNQTNTTANFTLS
ncbi:MAG TPA: carboxypeptidase-like regulatory domain-containing protein, partial [Ktedonobacterales bacterium]